MRRSASSGSGKPFITKEDYLFAKGVLKDEYKENTLKIRSLRNDIATLGTTEVALKERSEKQSEIAYMSSRQREIIDILLFLRLRADFSIWCEKVGFAPSFY